MFSAGIVSTIVSKSNTWNDLGDEFERGKQSQLTSMSSNAINPNSGGKLLESTNLSTDDTQNMEDEVKLLDI